MLFIWNMIVEGFNFFANNLNEEMAGTLLLALMFRYVTYRSGKQNQIYYKTFARTLEKKVEKSGTARIEDVETWIDGMLDEVTIDLPDRNLRLDAANKGNSVDEKSGTLRLDRRQSFEEYAHGKMSIVLSVKQRAEVFKSPHLPNFNDMTNRILEEDRKWRNIMKVIPVDALARMLDLLPGLFIVGGIFGTFIGIAAALPKIASIDLDKLDAAGPILNSFVKDIAYSMNTSIVGIICSVSLTILNTLFPVTSVRVDIQKNMSRIFEMIWRRIHGTEVDAGDRQIVSMLEKIYAALTDGKSKDDEKPSVTKKAS